PVQEDRSQVRDAALTDLDSVEDELRRLCESQVARVRVVPGSHAAVRLSARARGESGPGFENSGSESDQWVEIGTLDYRELAVELAGFGDQIAVLAPEALQHDVLN